MNDISYYYELLYNDEKDRLCTDDNLYEDLLKNNLFSYETIQKNYDISCKFLISLFLSGIPLWIIEKHIEFFVVPTFFSTILLLMNKAIKSGKEEKIIKTYFESRQEKLEEIKQNDKFHIYMNSNQIDYKKDINYAFKQFCLYITKYNEKYEGFILLEDEDIEILLVHLKWLVDKKIVTMNYFDLFIDVLNRACAKGLYNEKNIFIEDLIMEIPNVEPDNKELRTNVKDYYQYMNINLENTVIDISERKKR